MIGPAIDPADVGLTGLLWLFLSYGYVLYFASGMIGEGSELLLLVPSMAGLVGGVVLPLLGAVPDGAIILFSGLGSLDEAQETLSVGVGALAGSTIMLLTIPWAISIWSGRVDVLENGAMNYHGKPKCSANNGGFFSKTGVTLTPAVQQGGYVMMLTTIPYFLIQIPAMFLNGSDDVAEGEHWYALIAFLICIAGLVYYMKLQLSISQEGQDKDKRVAIVKKVLQKGQMSLSGALLALEDGDDSIEIIATDYESIDKNTSSNYPPPQVARALKEILHDAFKTYDNDGNGRLEKSEIRLFFRDFHESIAEKEIDALFEKYDDNKDGTISFDEFIGLSYNLMKSSSANKSNRKSSGNAAHDQLVENIYKGTPNGNEAHAENDDEEEEEEIPEEFTELSPEEQQAAIKKKAFRMLFIGTALVIFFSDPMVDVMQEIAVRANMSPFYVSFILAPLASNASEVLASQYYASKKTRKTITVSLTALEGAASMNNTFCLSIFMGLIFVRGLAWQYTSETLAIVAVQFIMGYLVRRSDKMTSGVALFVLSIFPLSLILVSTMESLGFD